MLDPEAALWRRAGDAVLGSQHVERREVEPGTVSPVSGRGAPLPKRGEAQGLTRPCGTLFEWRWLGRRQYRVVGQVIGGKASVWKLPTQDPAEAKALHQALDLHIGVDWTGALIWQSGCLRQGAAVAHIDLIKLAYFNNAHGHRVGDWALEGVGRALVHGLAPRRVFRTGGDEFLVEIPEPLDRSGAEMLASEIRRLVRQPIPGVPERLQARVGVTLLRNEGNEQAVLQSARAAEYQVAVASRHGTP